MSSDSGKTWHPINSFPGGNIMDINFFDRSTGLVADWDKGVFLTRNGGLTWTSILPSLHVEKVSFNGSTNVIHALEYGSSILSTSVDGGTSWRSVTLAPASGGGLGFGIANDGTIYVSSCDVQGSVGWVSSSSDLGVTWSPNSATFEGDAYTISVDSCDPKCIYLANENVGQAGDRLSHLRVSLDAGNTWLTNASLPSPCFGGSMATSSHAVFAGTQLSSGVVRSVDRGMTWTSIGGPANSLDTRLIASINDNTVLVVDSFDNIWGTFNGGGDSVISTGTELTMSTADQKTDIIGETVSVPIKFAGLRSAENINVVLHYMGDMVYAGSVDQAGAQLDMTGEQWPGRSKLHLTNVQSGITPGYARFNIYADSASLPIVTFDSAQVVSGGCQYQMPEAVTSTITPPKGCGTGILSEFLKTGEIPSFSIRPNPTTGEVLLSSSVDMGEATIEVYDMLGAERSSEVLTLTANSPFTLTLPSGDGMYYLRIRSSQGVSGSRVIVQH